MHVWNVLHAWRGSLEIQDAKNRDLDTIAQLCRAISSQLRQILTIAKNLSNSNTSSTCSQNMVNLGLLLAEICWRVWCTPANFNEFCVFAALLHDTLLVGVSQTAALNRRCKLYSSGRPSRWALAHISSFTSFTDEREHKVSLTSMQRRRLCKLLLTQSMSLAFNYGRP